jgi:glycerophosphoryl diester phosphodiesterase
VPSDSLKKTNYLRWSNNPWSVVEPESQNKAGDWSESDAARLDRLVDAAHDAGLWIRFYTLNGHPPEEGERMGWSAGYNFMSIDAARIRWRAAIDAGVDFIATDQYEEMARATSRR